MQLILVPTGGGKPCRTHVRLEPLILPALLIVVAIPVLCVLLGYHLGQVKMSELQQRWAAELIAQQELVKAARREAQTDVEVLTQQLGMAQAHLTRIDALGRKLVNMAELSDDEFNFGEEPGLGGPLLTDAIPSLAEEVPRLLALDSFEHLDQLLATLEDRYRQLSSLDSLIKRRNLQEDTQPYGLPVATGWISSPFGTRRDPFTGRRDWHPGIDFAGPEGTEIFAVASGVVTRNEYDRGYGFLVEVHHGNGYATRYAHNQRNLVQIGDTVAKGETIALMGSTGRSTGAHVHFEVIKDGRRTNPYRFVRSALAER